MNRLDRIADRLDLAIDFLTLGQYGLERRQQTSAPASGCEGGGRRRGHREALPPALSRGRDRLGRGTSPQPAA